MTPLPGGGGGRSAPSITAICGGLLVASIIILLAPTAVVVITFGGSAVVLISIGVATAPGITSTLLKGLAVLAGGTSRTVLFVGGGLPFEVLKIIALGHENLKEIGNLLVGLEETRAVVSKRKAIVRISRHTNSVDILLDSTMIDRGKIVIDNVVDVAYINAAGHDTSCNENGRGSGAERTHGALTFELGAIRVHGSARVA
ncbi:hypothetical protein HYQ46_011082 [Verticillium longisporum]|nr:hypothetical protein HYQ46_011082 [Verticillium longisporum]